MIGFLPVWNDGELAFPTWVTGERSDHCTLDKSCLDVGWYLGSRRSEAMLGEGWSSDGCRGTARLFVRGIVRCIESFV